MSIHVQLDGVVPALCPSSPSSGMNTPRLGPCTPRSSSQQQQQQHTLALKLFSPRSGGFDAANPAATAATATGAGASPVTVTAAVSTVSPAALLHSLLPVIPILPPAASSAPAATAAAPAVPAAAAPEMAPAEGGVHAADTVVDLPKVSLPLTPLVRLVAEDEQQPQLQQQQERREGLDGMARQAARTSANPHTAAGELQVAACMRPSGDNPSNSCSTETSASQQQQQLSQQQQHEPPAESSSDGALALWRTGGGVSRDNRHQALNSASSGSSSRSSAVSQPLTPRPQSPAARSPAQAGTTSPAAAYDTCAEGHVAAVVHFRGSEGVQPMEIDFDHFSPPVSPTAATTTQNVRAAGAVSSNNCMQHVCYLRCCTSLHISN